MIIKQVIMILTIEQSRMITNNNIGTAGKTKEIKCRLRARI